MAPTEKQLANLRPCEYGFTKEEMSRGGKASGEARRKKKALREALQILMQTDVTGPDGKKMTGTEAMAVRAFQSAIAGDWKAWELVRDTSGQKPADKVMVADVDSSVIEEVEEIVNGAKGSG